MKKMFTAGLAAVMAMSLCACGGGQTAPATTSAPAAETTAAAAETTAAGEEEKKEETDQAAAAGGGYVVALCNYSIGNSWRAQMEQEFMAEAEKLMEEYPWLKEIYQEMAAYMSEPKEVLNMFSEALKIMDRNTVQYMIEEQMD